MSAVKRRLFNVLAGMSLLILCAFAAAWLVSEIRTDVLQLKVGSACGLITAQGDGEILFGTYPMAADPVDTHWHLEHGAWPARNLGAVCSLLVIGDRDCSSGQDCSSVRIAGRRIASFCVPSGNAACLASCAVGLTLGCD